MFKDSFSVKSVGCSLLFLLLVGCAIAPPKKDNIIEAPIRIELKKADAGLKTKVDFVNEAVKFVSMQDELDRAQALKIAEKLYDNDISSPERNNISKRAEAALKNGLSGHVGRFHSAPNVRFVKGNGSSEVEGTGTAIAEYSAHESGRDNYGPVSKDAKATISVFYKYYQENDNIVLELSKAGYDVECVGKEYYQGKLITPTCSYRYLFKDSELLNLLNNVSSKPVKWLTPGEAAKTVQGSLNSRFKIENGSFAKTERTYNIDFATAKARLQRSFGAFKYDNDKSTFFLESSYSNPVAGSTKDIKQRYVISLFPERNNTTIEFSGDYEYFSDKFGGPEKYGKSFFDKEMSNYISKLNNIMKK